MTTEAVYKYMQEHNRPFGCNDLISVLDKEKHGKTAIQKSLDKLVDRRKIIVKTYGKQKIYFINHNNSQSKDEVVRMERELQDHYNQQKQKVIELEKEFKEQSNTLGSLKTEMTMEEALKEKENLTSNINEILSKVDKVLEASGSQDLSQKKKEVDKDFSLYNKECLKRKRICTNIIDSILESYPASKKQLLNDIGIEIPSDNP